MNTKETTYVVSVLHIGVHYIDFCRRVSVYIDIYTYGTGLETSHVSAFSCILSVRQSALRWLR